MAYWKIYIVMAKPEGEKLYRPYVGQGIGCVVAHESRKAARACLRVVRAEYGKGNAYIQKCGAIS